jgi:hypothetical protein
VRTDGRGQSAPLLRVVRASTRLAAAEASDGRVVVDAPPDPAATAPASAQARGRGGARRIERHSVGRRKGGSSTAGQGLRSLVRPEQAHACHGQGAMGLMQKTTDNGVRAANGKRRERNDKIRPI